MTQKSTSWRTTIAFALCAVGTVFFSSALLLLKPTLGPMDSNVAGNLEGWAALQEYTRIRPFLEGGSAAMLTFLGLHIARPSGIARNDYHLIVVLLAGLTIGYSASGAGEGFSTSYALVAIPGMLIGLLLKYLFDRAH